MEQAQNTLNTVMDNPLVVGIIAIAITMYGPRLSPKLPDPIRQAFNSAVFRFLILALIIFVGFRDIRMSLVIAILFVILMSIVNQENIKEDFRQQVNEYYANYNLYNKRNMEHFENKDVEDDTDQDTDQDTDDDDGKVNDDSSKQMVYQPPSQLQNIAYQNQPPSQLQNVDMSDKCKKVFDLINANKITDPMIDQCTAEIKDILAKQQQTHDKNAFKNLSSQCVKIFNLFGENGISDELREQCKNEGQNQQKQQTFLSHTTNQLFSNDQVSPMGDKLKQIESQIQSACNAFKGLA